MRACAWAQHRMQSPEAVLRDQWVGNSVCDVEIVLWLAASLRKIHVHDAKQARQGWHNQQASQFIVIMSLGLEYHYFVNSAAASPNT